MLGYLRSTPILRPENSVNIWNILWLSRRLIICTEQTSIYISTFLKTVTSEWAKNDFDKRVHRSMSRTAISMKFKLSRLLEKGKYQRLRLRKID